MPMVWDHGMFLALLSSQVMTGFATTFQSIFCSLICPHSYALFNQYQHSDAALAGTSRPTKSISVLQSSLCFRSLLVFFDVFVSQFASRMHMDMSVNVTAHSALLLDISRMSSNSIPRSNGSRGAGGSLGEAVPWTAPILQMAVKPSQLACMQRARNEENSVAGLRCFALTGMLRMIPSSICPAKPRSPMAAAY